MIAFDKSAYLSTSDSRMSANILSLSFFRGSLLAGVQSPYSLVNNNRVFAYTNSGIRGE
jgi:hypothetical protein